MSVPSHTHCENSKTANAGTCVTPSHSVTDFSPTYSEKQQETPAAMPVVTQHYHTCIFI